MSGIARKLMGVTKVGEPPADPDLVLVFDTTLATGTTVTVPLAGTVDVVIDWGDGNSEAFTTSGDKTHTYTAEGEYTVRVSGSLAGFGSVASRPNLTKCLSFGGLGVTSLDGAFRSCSNLTETPTSIPSSVTSMSEVFFLASSFNQDIGSWGVSNVTNMGSMFRSAASFNQDISSWNVSNVTDMNNLFNSASDFNQNIGGWNVSNVTNMFRAFTSATSFNQDIDAWDVSSVTNMNDMFRFASAITFPLGSWQTNLSGQPSRFSGNANATFQSYRGTTDFPLLADGVTRINT